jgi:hypothetical protein
MKSARKSTINYQPIIHIQLPKHHISSGEQQIMSFST